MRLLSIVCAFLLYPATAAKAQLNSLGGKAGEAINIDSDETDYDHSAGVATARGNVHIIYGDTEILAGKAEYHIASGDIHAENDVSIYKGELAYKGNAAIYNINTGKVTANQLKSGKAPLFYESDSFDTQLKQMESISMTSSTFTTHDSANPNYRIKAKKVDIIGLDRPKHQQRIIFRNMTVYAGNTPVFWLPYLSQPLDAEQGYHFVPGYRSNWGAFLLNRYGMMIGDHTLATYHLDLRSSRGVAGGVDLKLISERENEHFGNLKLYYANDNDPSQTHNKRVRKTPIDPDRYRLNLQHRIYLPGTEDDTLYLDLDINKISDAFFYEDFFPDEYRINPQPDNLISLQKIFPRGSASLWARFQANDFYRTTTHLPELALDFTTQPIGKTGLFYTGSTSAGIYNEKLGSIEREKMLVEIDKLEARAAGLTEGQPQRIRELSLVEAESMLGKLKAQANNETGFTRLDSYHQVSAPREYFGWLHVNPRAGFRATSYSNVEGGGSSDKRTVFHLGLDTSFKVSRDYADFKLPRLGINGIRHVVQPYLNYSFVASDELNAGIGKIDRLIPSTKLRPIDLAHFTATDSITDWNIIRPGVSQRFQTRRDGNAFTWLELNSYLDAYIKDPEYDRNFSNIYNSVTFKPVHWLSLRHEIGLPILADEPFDYKESNTHVAFMPSDRFEFVISHRYLQDHPLFENSNLLDFRAYYRLSDRWGLSARQRYEFDDGTLEYQQYTVHYDLNSWTAGLGALISDHRSGSDEFGIVLTLTLKDFPSLSIPVGLTPTH